MSDHAVSIQIAASPRRIRFGPFEADCRTGELRKHDVKIKLGQQTFQILLMLLEHPGEVVLREDVRLKLWPRDTVVEFDHSINAAIQKLRGALGESAEQPVYIETLPRRGYRFIGTVEPAPAAPPAILKPLEPVAGPAPKGRRRLPRSAILPAAGIALVALLAWAILIPRPAGPPAQNFSFSLGEIGNSFALSPDGSAVVYAARGLHLRRMNSVKETAVDTLVPIIDTPAWSADGSQVAIATMSGIYRMPVPDGPPIRLSRLAFPPRGLAWAPDGSILVAMFSGKQATGALYAIPSGGGEPARLDVPGLSDGMFYEPEFLPDGKNVLFAWSSGESGYVGWYLAKWDGGKFTHPPVLLGGNVTCAHYSPMGGPKLLYVQNDKLYAQTLNVARGRLEGAPEELVDGVVSQPISHRAIFSVSRNGVLVWRAGSASLAQATWFDRTGKVLGVAGPSCLPDLIRLSPDGKHFLLRRVAEDAGYAIAESNRSGFVPLSQLSSGALWMPDGSHLLCPRNVPDGVSLLERAVEGVSEREVAHIRSLGDLIDVSPDGQALLYHSGLQLYCLRLDDPHARPEVLAESVQARFSPDGHWIAYVNEASGTRNLWVRPFPSGGLPVQLTTSGGTNPIWQGDGRAIVYRAGSTIYSIGMHVQGARFSADQPEPLFDVRVPGGLTGDSMPLDVTHDGSRIIFAQGGENTDSGKTYIMTNWTAASRGGAPVAQ